MAKKIAWVLGVVFVLAGIMGWIPNPIVGPGAIFETNHAHDMVHLLTGLLFIVTALFFETAISLVFKVFGIVYLLVAILGFLTVPTGGLILGLVDTNMADHLLHVVLGVVIIALGFFVSKGGMAMPMPSNPSGSQPMNKQGMGGGAPMNKPPMGGGPSMGGGNRM